jgi:hypothetical protein
MLLERSIPRRRKGVIGGVMLLLIAFSTALFPRVFISLKIPSAINFLHFLVVPFVCGVILLKARPKDPKQIAITQDILLGLLLFLSVGFASALLNNAGAINVILKFLLLGEPFLLLLAIIYVPMSLERFKFFRTWMNRFVFFHLFLVYAQYALGFCKLEGLCDNVQGVFYRSGSGHVVGASVSASFAIYYFLVMRENPLWQRAAVAIAGFGNILTSDAKQVLVTLVVGFAIISLSKIKEPGKLIAYLVSTIVFIAAFIWTVYNVEIEALRAFQTWVRPEIYGPNGEATLVKSSGIRIAIQHFHSPLNWLLGLGPGHTVDRLGGWMLKDYAELLNPLGATRSTVAAETWSYMGRPEVVWVAAGSSFFAPFFGWAAIWGDLGFLGLGSYLYLCSIVWRRICIGDLPKFLMLTVMVHGFLFTQMEEPGYMLYIASLIGLIWQGNRLHNETKSSRHCKL